MASTQGPEKSSGKRPWLLIVLSLAGVLAAAFVLVVPPRIADSRRAELIPYLQQVDAVQQPRGPFLNHYILKAAGEYAGHTRYRFDNSEETLATLGIVDDIHYLGRERYSTTGQDEIHCIGFIFNLYVRAAELYAKEYFGEPHFRFPGLPGHEFADFQREFYGADGNRRTLVNALVSRGMAREIHSLEDARPGDLVQFWREGGLGHSAIFLDVTSEPWQQNSRLRFFSVHGTGIGIKEEMIGEPMILEEEIFIARPAVPRPI